jgi:hypothetical protein
MKKKKVEPPVYLQDTLLPDEPRLAKVIYTSKKAHAKSKAIQTRLQGKTPFPLKTYRMLRIICYGTGPETHRLKKDKIRPLQRLAYWLLSKYKTDEDTMYAVRLFGVWGKTKKQWTQITPEMVWKNWKWFEEFFKGNVTSK